MSLKSIGELGNTVKLLNGFSSKLDVAKGLGGLDEFYKIVNSLEGLDIDQASKKLKDLKLNPSLSVDLLDAAKSEGLLVGSADEINDGLKKINASSKACGSNLKNIGSGLLTTFTSLLPVILGVAAAIAAFKVADVLNYTYDEKQSDYQNAKSKYDDTLSELESIKSSQDEVRTSLESLGEKYGITFNQSDSLDTMISKLQELNLTLPITGC